ncbi:AMP-dependent synthetase and ligase [Methanothermus fervidus DSM 2088]|uniref:AMP-dependent synthetase and ligase n=1 Tax=Methanothermus fervidus (strain ATCC 43054 / DSM 2088 / JCM 10308 / V24 S) TaxID=523846 RepID=E3GY35_METFV|nr:AMP-binding protein [Methanothermus fervidus]ADP77217.1 AMP-dependent synthetase and ligase [Methanothermus fervidus DSM 2088]
MASLLNEFVNRVNFESYEDFKKNFKIIVPDNFNFAYDVVDRYAEEVPGKRALVWCDDNGNEKILNFADMKLQSDKVANFLRNLGVKKGDKVMLTLKGRYEFWFSLLALHKIGAIAVPATHMLREKDIVYRIKKAGIDTVISVDDKDLIESYESAEKKLGVELKKIIVGNERDGWLNFREEVKKTPSNFKKPEGDKYPSGNDISLIYFSSGTTGMPKMIQHDFNYPLAHIITAKYWQNVREGGLHYTLSDTGWAKSVWGQIYGQWIAGSAVFVYDFDRFDPHKVLKKIEKYKINTFCAPPTVYRFFIKQDLSKYDLSSIEHAVTAGEPLNPEVFKKFYEETGIKIMEGFGQTECTLCIANFIWMEPKPGSMGKPSPLYDVKVVDKEGNEVDIGEEGEIAIDTSDGRPLGLFLGYYKDPEKTKKAWHNDLYHTGDTAWVDEDGYFWFVGRNDDVINSSGYRIGPFEVESAIISHPAVLECAVTGYPDPIRGQVVKATIVLTDGYEPSEKLKKEIQEHVKKVTAPYKYPRIIEFVDELPKTISGKIKRAEIRKRDEMRYKKEQQKKL